MSTAMTGYNEHNIRNTTVNGKTLQQHRGFDPNMSALGRRLLATEDAVTDVHVDSRSLDVWFRRADRINWEPPAGYRVETVSTFLDPDEWSTTGAVCVELVPEADA